MSSDVLDRESMQIPGRPAAVRTRAFALSEVRWAAAATLLFVLGLAAQYGSAPAWVWWALYLACYGAGGWEPALAGMRALRRPSLDVDLLMIVAAIGAAAIGQVLDGGLLIVIFATSGALEAFLTQRTADSVRSLLDLAPERATRMSADGEQIVDTASLMVGDVILVRPGERIGADGQVVSGASDVDQASITGEPLPVVKEPGEEVFAGTLNGTGVLRVRVDRAAADTVLARIVAMVEEASATKAKAQLFIERVEQYYSIGVVAATLAVFAIPLALGAAMQPSLLRAMTFMIVASPCAVVLATMPPLLAAMANAGRHGVLVKSAVVMEQLGSVTIVAFDKTGTLTHGTPRLTDVRPLTGTGLAADELLTLAAAAEHPSEHPLAAAVVAAARERGLTLPTTEAFESTPGCGVRAVVAGRQSRSAARRNGNPSTRRPLAAMLTPWWPSWKPTARPRWSSPSQCACRCAGLEDHLRADAAGTIEKLIELTGANTGAVDRRQPSRCCGLATRVAIGDVRASLLPQDKVAAVRDLKAEGSRVLLVGDGVNDAPRWPLRTRNRHGPRGFRSRPGHRRRGRGPRRTRHHSQGHRPIAAGPPRGDRQPRRRGHNYYRVGDLRICSVTYRCRFGVAGHEGSTVVVGLNGMRLLSRRLWQLPVTPPPPITSSRTPVCVVQWTSKCAATTSYPTPCSRPSPSSITATW